MTNLFYSKFIFFQFSEKQIPKIEKIETREISLLKGKNKEVFKKIIKKGIQRDLWEFKEEYKKVKSGRIGVKTELQKKSNLSKASNMLEKYKKYIKTKEWKAQVLELVFEEIEMKVYNAILADRSEGSYDSREFQDPVSVKRALKAIKALGFDLNENLLRIFAKSKQGFLPDLAAKLSKNKTTQEYLFKNLSDRDLGGTGYGRRNILLYNSNLYSHLRSKFNTVKDAQYAIAKSPYSKSKDLGLLIRKGGENALEALQYGNCTKTQLELYARHSIKFRIAALLNKKCPAYLFNRYLRDKNIKVRKTIASTAPASLIAKMLKMSEYSTSEMKQLIAINENLQKASFSIQKQLIATKDRSVLRLLLRYALPVNRFNLVLAVDSSKEILQEIVNVWQSNYRNRKKYDPAVYTVMKQNSSKFKGKTFRFEGYNEAAKYYKFEKFPNYAVDEF